MNSEIKAAWTTALRSGEYRQGKDVLNRTVGGQQELCCLGVLCELAVKDGVIDPPVSVGDRSLLEYDGCTVSLPSRVMKWAGIDSTEGDLPNHVETVEGDDAHCLSGLNDTGSTFAQIADVIEEHF